MNEEKSTRYHRLKRRASVGALVWSMALLVVLVTTGWSLQLRDTSEQLATVLVSKPYPAFVVCLYVVLLTLVNEVGSLPLGFYSGFILERRYGLSNERLGRWALDQVKALVIGLVFSAGAGAVVYFFIRLSPDRWWLPTGVVFALVIVGLANVAPVVLLPLFYSTKPLDRESLRMRLLALANRAGARVLGVYELGMAAKTKKANAALAGLGSTRRILVSDTMLSDYSEDEIEVVLAHEIAHHVHGDIWKGLIFESGLVLAGAFVAARALGASVSFMALRGPGDVAGLPVLVLSVGLVSLVMLPTAHALSRAFERSADRFALELTRNPAAFVSAMRRLAAQNLAEEHPSKVIQWLFYSHPPIHERIARAQAFKP